VFIHYTYIGWLRTLRVHCSTILLMCIFSIISIGIKRGMVRISNRMKHKKYDNLKEKKNVYIIVILMFRFCNYHFTFNIILFETLQNLLTDVLVNRVKEVHFTDISLNNNVHLKTSDRQLFVIVITSFCLSSIFKFPFFFFLNPRWLRTTNQWKYIFSKKILKLVVKLNSF